MSSQRRQRLEAVIGPLVGLNRFSQDEAKQHCSSASPAQVTRTLRQLVRDGLLIVSEESGGIVYQWQWGRTSVQQTRRWIDRQLRTAPPSPEAKSIRPDDRLLRCGPSSLSDVELLTVLIRAPLDQAREAAQCIANQFSMRWQDLVELSPAELRAVASTVTPLRYSQIMAGIELGRRVALAQRPFASYDGITSTAEAIEFCRQTFRRLAHDAVQEEFHVVTLDTKHKPIGTHQVTVGTLDASLVHPREVFRPAIRHAAAAVLLVHNHPSGDPKPSREDQLVTQQLTEAGKLLGIQVLDHIVVARNGCVSMREG